jgi:pimeloyl-ACP methyl ester carboxylesterase
MSISNQLGEVREAHVKQGTVRYRERGSGDPIVFVHGFLANGDLWRKVVPSLAGEWRCIAPDWPMGSHELAMEPDADLSAPGMADLIADFIEELGLERVTLVGNDSGGAMCQVLVTRRPERIERLVLTACDGFEVFPPPFFNFLKPFVALPGGIAALVNPLRFRPLRRSPIAYGWTSKRKPEPAIYDSYVGPSIASAGVRRDIRKFLRGMRNEHTLDAAAKFGRFDRPVLVAWAPDDKFFPMDIGRRLAAAFPDARLELIEDSYAFTPEDQPERLAQLIAQFARETRGAGREAARTA